MNPVLEALVACQAFSFSASLDRANKEALQGNFGPYAAMSRVNAQRSLDSWAIALDDQL